MKIQFDVHGKAFQSDTSAGISIAIPMNFSGPQPNHFGAPKANQSVLKLGGFVGETQQGGSCNVDSLSMTPHCNGTHTETVGHIVNEDIFVGHTTKNLLTATLITLEEEPARGIIKRGETYRPKLDADKDWVISRAQLEFAFRSIDLPETDAIIITTHNGRQVSARSRQYTEQNQPAFFTVEAMQLIVEKNCQHLLVDLPSVDRMYDDGLLTNHHLFWNVKEGTHTLGADTWQGKTITEMVQVPNEVEDGLYLLNLQVPSFCSDAAPSRPVIYPMKLVT